MYDLHAIELYIYKYRPDGLIIDTNLLILFLVGKFDESFIEKCKLVKGDYCIRDYNILCQIIKRFKKIVITPHIITELSNLSKKEFRDQSLLSYFSVFINLCKKSFFEENNVYLKDILEIDLVIVADFGFTDVAIYQLSKKGNFAVITSDGKFSARFNKEIPIIEFNSIKNSFLNSFIK